MKRVVYVVGTVFGERGERERKFTNWRRGKVKIRGERESRGRVTECLRERKKIV